MTEQQLLSALQNVDSRFNEDELRLNMIGQTITNMGITITNEQFNREAGDTQLQNTIDENERVTSAALNDLNSRINAIDLTGYATQTWVTTNYYNKSYIDQTIGNIETLLSQI